MDLRLYIVVLSRDSSQKEEEKLVEKKKKATLVLGLCIQEAGRNTHGVPLNLARNPHSLAKKESKSAQKEYCVSCGMCSSPNRPEIDAESG